MNLKEFKQVKSKGGDKKIMKTKIKQEKGITLIALVVTIVVLLILAGVSVNALFGNSGIIEKAKEAQNAMDKAKENDEKGINELTNWIDNQVNGTTGGNNNPTTSDLPSVAGETMPYYPDATFKKVEGTNLADGLVIQDESGNEYVWIEVPKTTGVYPTAGLKITNFTETEYTAIETDLHTYTDYYRRDKSGTLTSYKDEYSSDKVEAGTGLTSAKYTELKQKMLKSVYENGGFWIGRYEAGITTNRTSASGTPTEVPLSKVGTVENPVYPYTYVTCSQAQTLANMKTTENYTSSLMFGVQWDLVLKHIETKIGSSNLTTSNGKNILTQDSSSWGNYCNASFTINRGKYADSRTHSLSTTWTPYNQTTSNNFVNVSSVKQVQSGSDGILLTTGASDACKKMNIYDLAGNVWEWTLEYSNYSYGPCVIRAGSGIDSDSEPPTYRMFDYTTNKYGLLGFRVSLFK